MQHEPFLTITPLGGLGEIGLNCQKWESAEGLVLVDCGLMFPLDYHLGIDVIIPRFDSLVCDKERTLGVVLTHGHEDHIGALPWLVPHFKSLDIYGSPFTLALVEHKLTEHALMDRVTLHPMEDYASATLGDMRFTFIPVTHSIPQGCALAVDTPIGKIIHTGDFKLDPAPLSGPVRDLPADITAFAGAEGIRLLLSDSTNIEKEGYSRPESEVRETLREIFHAAQGRIVITLFSSHIDRIRTVLELARECGRAVLISGRSLSSNMEKAANLGLLELYENIYSDAASFSAFSPEKTVLIATGSQGEPLSALTRIATGEHKQISLQKGDTVIMSSRVIPGNARSVSRLVDQMYKQGARVFNDAKRTIHATGHACEAELSAILTAAKPQYFIPVHGEYRHLVLHSELAMRLGVAEENTFLLEDGQPITLTASAIRREPAIAVESVLVDGKGVGDVGRLVLKERRLLGDEGLVIVVLVIAQDTGEVLYGPQVISRGFVFEQRYDHILEDSKCLILDQLESMTRPDPAKLHDGIRTQLRRFFRDVLDRDPIVVPVISVV